MNTQERVLISDQVINKYETN